MYLHAQVENDGNARSGGGTCIISDSLLPCQEFAWLLQCFLVGLPIPLLAAPWTRPLDQTHGKVDVA